MPSEPPHASGFVRFLRSVAPAAALAIAVAVFGGAAATAIGGWLGGAAAGVITTYAVPTLIWAFGAFAAARALDVLVLDGTVRRSLGRPLPKLVRQFCSALIYLIAGTIVAANVYNLSVAGVWATSGVLGIAIGFGARTMIFDLLAGLAIAADQSIRIGDWIEYRDRNLGDPAFGQVIAMNWRSVRVLLRDHRTMVLPNHLISQMAVLNHTIPEAESRFEFLIPLSADVPHERALRILGAAASAGVALPGMAQKPTPNAYVAEIVGDIVWYKIEYFQYVAQRSPSGGRHLMMQTILTHLRMAGLRPARQVEDVVLRRSGDDAPFDSLDDRAALLGRVSLLADALAADELETLAATARLRIAAQGEALVERGESGDSMFIVAEGLLEARLPGGETGEGEDKTLGRIQPGEFFGEMSLLTGEQRAATVVALTGVRAYEITRDNMQSLLESRPELAEELEMAVLERRFEMFDTMMESIDAAQHEAKKPSGQELLDRMRHFLTGR